MPTTTGVIIPEDTQDAIYEVELESASRAQIIELVGGGDYCRYELKSGALCFINDQSVRVAQIEPTDPTKRLDLNPRSTALLGLGNCVEEDTIHVVGPMLILGPGQGTGHYSSIPPLLYSLLFEHTHYRIEYQAVGQASNWQGGLKVYTDPFGAAVDAMAVLKSIDVVAVRVVPA